jgi:hypothetical protein
MTPKLKDEVRKLILAELRTLLDEFRRVRSLRLSEGENSAHSDYLAKRVELARTKLADLKTLQQREKKVQNHRSEIDRENRSHH